MVYSMKLAPPESTCTMCHKIGLMPDLPLHIQCFIYYHWLLCQWFNIFVLIIMSIYLFNRRMKRISDTRVKKGCCILTILDDGSSFLYKYPPGSLLSPSSSNFKCPITMMENTNSSHTEVGLIAAICSDNPSKVDSGNIEHDIILCQGYFFWGRWLYCPWIIKQTQEQFMSSFWFWPMYYHIGPCTVTSRQFVGRSVPRGWKITAQGRTFNTLFFVSDC